MALEAMAHRLTFTVHMPINNPLYATYEFIAYSESQAGAFIRVVRDATLCMTSDVRHVVLNGKSFDWSAI